MKHDDQANADVDKLRAALAPLLEQGMHPSALLYVGATMMSAVVRHSDLSVEQAVLYLTTLHEESYPSRVPPGVAVH